VRASQAQLRQLEGLSIFLSIGSASVRPAAPSPRDRESTFDRTVAALGRALFASGCRLIMRPHPDYTPMLALLAAEYPVAPAAEPRGDERERPTVQPPLVLAGESAAPDGMPRSWRLLRKARLIDGLTDLDDGLPPLAGTLEAMRPFAMIVLGRHRDDENVYRRMVRGGRVIPLAFASGGSDDLEERPDAGADIDPSGNRLYRQLSDLGNIWARERRETLAAEGREPWPEESAPEGAAIYRPIQATVQLLVRDLIERRPR
jgi:hypothetical protein